MSGNRVIGHTHPPMEDTGRKPYTCLTLARSEPPVTHNAVVHNVLTDELRDQASLFSLGLLNPEEAAWFQSHVRECTVCAGELRECMELVAVLTATLAEDDAEDHSVAPSPHVKEALLRQISALAVPEPVAAEPEAKPETDGVIVRAEEGRWHKYLPGIEVKRLFVDPVTRNISSLLRVAAGAVYPAHRHAGLEHLYVVDGDAIFNDHTLNTGDYEARGPQSMHSAVTSTEGCLLLVIHNQHDEVL